MAKRKWDSIFMDEMNRSVRAWIRRWTGKKGKTTFEAEKGKP